MDIKCFASFLPVCSSIYMICVLIHQGHKIFCHAFANIFDFRWSILDIKCWLCLFLYMYNFCWSMFCFVFACACNFDNNRVGTLHIKVFSDIHIRVGTLHMKKCSDDLTKAGTPHTYTGMWGHCTYFDDEGLRVSVYTICYLELRIEHWTLARERPVQYATFNERKEICAWQSN